MKDEKLALKIAVVYIAMSGVVMVISNDIFGYSYGDYHMLKIITVYEAVMFLYSIMAYRSYFQKQGFLNFKVPILTPSFIIFSLGILITFMIFLVTGDFSGHWELFINIAISTLFISVSEELIFRGILVEVFLKKYSVLSAVFLSALIYACSDIVNLLGGVPFRTMLMQFLGSLILGILLACFAVQMKNIVPIMLIHWLWDLLGLSFMTIESKAGLGMLLMSILGIISSLFLLLRVTNTTPTKSK